MFLFRKKTEMVDAASALKGHSDRFQLPRRISSSSVLSRRHIPRARKPSISDGCFWGAERKFWQIGDGIWTTAVGYAGGFTPNATYDELCTGRTGHARSCS